MTAVTVSGLEAMAQISMNVGETTFGLVTTATSATSIACSGNAETTNDRYVGGKIRIVGGTTFATISAYTGSTKTFTLASPGLTGIAAGNIVEWFGFNMQKRGALFASVNRAIEAARDLWYRETHVDRTSATITLASGTNAYTLPDAVVRLVQIGIQPTTRDGITWFDPLKIYRVYGEEGALTLEFLPGYSGMYSVAWSSRARTTPPGSYATFADAFANEPLCLKYYTYEPLLTSETGTTRLPLDYLGWVGAEFYCNWILANGSDDDRRGMNIFLPQVQANAARARARLGLTKPKPYQPIQLDF